MITPQGHAQSISLTGKVTDKQSGEDLIGAHIFLKEHDIGIVTNRYGHFTVNIPPADSIRLTVSFLGYQKLDTVLYPKHPGQMVEFSLTEQITTLLSVNVTANTEDLITVPDLIKISSGTIEQLPDFFGEKDLVKALQFMPGVTSGSEGGSNLFVRGGTPDQNLYLLDDVPIYNINHLANFVSIFNTDAINKVELYKGNFPARYGGRLSSIVDVQMKEGNRNDFHLSTSIGPISGKVMAEGPLNSKMSYMVSARRFWIDFITWPVSKLLFNGIGVGYNFGDYNLKLNYKASARNHFYLSLYNGRDNIKFGGKGKLDDSDTKSKFTQRWGNDAIGLRWSHVPASNLFINTTLYHTRYIFKNVDRFEITNQNTESDNQISSGISEAGIKTQWEWYITPALTIQPGAGMSWQNFNPGRYQYLKISDGRKVTDTLFQNKISQTLQPFGYLDVSYDNQLLQIKGGLRFVNLSGIDDKSIRFNFLEPRISVGSTIASKTKLSLSYSQMNQSQQLLSKSGVGFPTDIWVPVSKGIDPGYAIQWSLEIQHNLFEGNLGIRGAIFHKQLDNLVAFKPGATFFTQAGRWQEKVVPGGKGDIKGLEIMAEKKSGRITGWASYTWMKSERQFKLLNDGKKFPFRYDRRHEINLVGIYQLKENISLSATWSYHTGDAITLATQKFPAIADSYYYHNQIIDNDEIIPFFSFLEDALLYEDRNSFRMRDFHRLDLNMSFRKEKKKGFRSWDITIINAYNRKNPYAYYYGFTYETIKGPGTSSQVAGDPKLLQLTLFPFLPSVSYKRVF